MPLYYWVNDAAPGDTTGQEVNDVWFVVAPTDSFSSTNAQAATAATDEGEPDY